VRTKTSTYRLRLPASLKEAVERLRRRDSTCIDQFVVVTVAEKVSAMTVEEVLDERAGTPRQLPTVL